MGNSILQRFRAARAYVLIGLGASLFFAGGFWGGLVLAAGAEPPARYAIHQPAQPLTDSLRAVARQTGVSLLFDPRAVQGLVSAPISGQFSAAEAVNRLLQGTGLVLVVQPDGALVVRAPRAGERVPGPGSAAAPADAPQASEKIEITGSRLRRIDADAALPVNVYHREDIERSGQPSLGRFLAGLNEISLGQGEGSFTGTTQGQGNVQLRGLPLGSTLVLINGRRVQAVGSSSGNFFNLNLIPLAAVERVEIVPVGSSAVYGGDALAGVVNVILRKSIDGHSFSARVSSGRGFGDGGLSLGVGDSGEAGAWMVIGSLAKATPLTMDERAFFRDVDFRRFGGPDTRARNCNPGTVSSTTAANLPGLGAGFAAIPETLPGQPLTVESFLPTAGQANLCASLSANGAAALVHGSESLGLHALGHRKLSDSLSAFGELTHVRDRVFADGRGINFNNVLVPASNPHNPFGVAVRVTARLGPENGREAYARSTDFTRLLAGVRGEFASGWDFEGVVSTSRDAGERVLAHNTANTAARTAALADTNPATALNPFATGRAAPDAVLRSIWSDAVRDNDGRRDLVGGFARGPLLELPAGTVEAIAGLEAGRDRYASVQAGAGIVASRSTAAAYAELRLPLWRGRAVGEREAERDWTMAALTLAGRGDNYSDFGSASTYQAGLELRPLRSLLFRGSAATSFKPPTLLQTHVNEAVFPIEAAGVTDPRRGGEPVEDADWVRMANADLQPEQGKALALGAVWEPGAGTGFRLAATAWRVRIDDMIGTLDPQAVLDHEGLFPGWVVRTAAADGGAGRITRLVWAESNFGFVETRGLDLEASHAWQTALGRGTIGLSATKTTAYTVAIAPGVGAEHRVGVRFTDYWAPSWKGRVSLGWDRSVWSVGISSRFVASYQDAATGDRKLGGGWVHDLSGRLDLKRLGLDLGMAKTAALSFSVVNATDRLPQYASGAPYFDTTQADWRGRFASMRLSMDW